jgi:hypothetical protein
MSKRTSAFVFDVFACWPPGPPDALNRHSNSATSIAQERLTRSTGPSTNRRLRGCISE